MVNRCFALVLVSALAAVCPFSVHAAQNGQDLFTQLKAKAEKGDAEAQLALGNTYANGAVVERDYKKAFKWHRKAAEQHLARAEYQLGLDYGSGEGVKEDKAEAVRWFQRAADQGLAEAQFGLGLAYQNGRGVRENPEEAAKWFRRAADQGYAEGQSELGNCYLEGNGVPKDTLEAVRWIRLAAEAGSARAQNTLGECYQQGKGMAKDPVQAYKWVSLAAAHGGDSAPDFHVNLAKLEAVLTPEQIAVAQHMAAEFKPGDAPTGQGNSGSSNPVQSATNSATEPIGTLNVTTEDGQCDIYVDGNFVGNSPAKLGLSAGAHTLEIKKAGFKNYRRELKVGAGSELTLRPVLEKE